ncbi:MAG TPA: hypothetical protein VF132_09805, partial [Rudaea sp.]
DQGEQQQAQGTVADRHAGNTGKRVFFPSSHAGAEEWDAERMPCPVRGIARACGRYICGAGVRREF